MDSKLNAPIFFVCNDPERALGLENIVEDYHIICIDNSPLVQTARKQGVNIFSLAEVEGVSNPIYRSSAKLLQNPRVQKYIKENTPKGQKPNIITFKISLKIETVCNELNYNVLNTTSALNKKFELKISQYNSLNTLVSSFPKTIIAPLNKLTYHEIKRKMGQKFVIQYNRGHTGKSTIFINNEKEYIAERRKYPNRLARVAEYIEGEMYTMNMCITRFGIVYGGLSYQITGVKGLTSKKGGTVGNDWLYPEKLTKKSHTQIQEILSRVHKKMYDSGYRGMVGIDFAITEKQRVYVIEINARQPASTSMHTKLMLNEEFIPLQAFHLAEFLFENNTNYIRFLNKYFQKGLAESNIQKYVLEQNKLAMLPTEAAQIIIRNTGKKRKKITENVHQGIYIYQHKNLVKTNEGYNITDIIPSEYVILATRAGQIVSPDNEITRLQAVEGIINKSGEVKKNIQEILDKIMTDIKTS